MESVSLVGKTALVTGANTGIGKETARELARRGGRIIIACRNQQKAEAARNELVESTGNNDVIVMSLDLSSMLSIKQFADDFNANEVRLDLLVNNAGVTTTKRTLTEHGFELHFGVNHLGHFYLTNLLLDKLKASAPSRVVTVSSDGHKWYNFDWNDLQIERNWSWMKAYCRSKTANVLFSSHLAKILEGTGVTAYCVHPGLVDSELARETQDSCMMSCVMKSIACVTGGYINTVEGAQTTLYCCLEPSIQNHTGRYYSECREKQAKSFATDPQLAENLWRISADMCKLS